MLSWDDFDKNEEIKKEEPVEKKVIEKSVIEKAESLNEENTFKYTVKGN